MTDFVTKDSGKRVEFDSGMRRDTDEGKPRYDLIYKPLQRRLALLMGRGVPKYGERNWEKARSIQEFCRFLSSAERHFQQYINCIKYEVNQLDIEGGREFYFEDVDEEEALKDRVEDHAAAILFNVSASEYVLERLKKDENTK